MTTITNDCIRFATEKDIKNIHRWLVSQDKKGIHGTFLCNWDLTQEIYNEGSLIVYIDDKSNEPIAYIWADFGILEVRENKRGQGIGRALTEYAIEKKRKLGEVAIRIECAPLSSIPFWKHMGFNLYTDKYAYILLNQEYLLPEIGNPVVANIKFYPECKKWEAETPPIESFSPTAVKTPEGIIHFDRLVSIFTGKNEWDYDPVVEISVDGNLLYLDKAKYPEASDLGVIQSSYAFSIKCLYV